MASHLDPVSRLAVRLLRLTGDSIHVVSRRLGVSNQATIKLSAPLRDFKGDKEAGMRALQAITLREIGALDDDEALFGRLADHAYQRIVGTQRRTAA